MSESRTYTAAEGSAALSDGLDLYFGEFDSAGFGLDSDEPSFLPLDLRALSAAELRRLCDQAFEELDTPSPGPTARDNYSVLSEELREREAENAVGMLMTPEAGRTSKESPSVSGRPTARPEITF
ncbi:hypothetical protein GCM10027404_22520 [Arthrobacter tumbae]